MNSTLSALFPNMSQACRDANTDVPATSGRPAKKTSPTATRDAIRAILNHDEDRNNRAIPDSKPQSDEEATLGATIQGKTEGFPRVRVRFTGYRVRPLDPDNFAGSCKDLLDGLRHSGLISGDEPWSIIFETEQKKVPSFTHEKTVITIEFPYP